MSLWRELARRLDWRRAREADFERELRAHLDLEAEEQREAGLPPAAARYAALRSFGNTTLVGEEVREMWGWTWLERLMQDLRFGLRQLGKSPGFAAIAILTLALGIGANTAIFTLVHAVLLKSLPVAKPQELYSLGDTKLCCDTTSLADLPNFALYSYPLYKHLRDNNTEFSELTAFQSWLSNLSVRRSGSSAPAEPFTAAYVSGNYFDTFGISAYAGHGFTLADDQPNAPPVAVISYRAWTQRFGSDPSVVGGTFTFNGQPMTVVGVAPQGFFGEALRPDPADFWIPLTQEPVLDRDNPLLDQPGEFWLYALGRLRPAARPEQLQARLTTEVQHWVGDLAGLSEDNRRAISKLRVQLIPAGTGVARLRSSYGDGLRLLMMVSALVLLIACANIANLLLARGMANRLQTALRVALGASRARLIRQMLTEGILLSTLGGIAGLLAAFVGTRAILLLAFQGASFVPIDASPSLPVMAFAFFLSLLTGVIFSVAPAMISSRAHPAEALRGAGRSTRDHSALPQKAFVILQAALSLVLLVGAGLLTESLRHLENEPHGFDTQSRVIVRVNPSLAGYTLARLPALYRQLQDRFASLPGVRSASLALHSPMDGWNWNSPVWVEGRPPAANTGNDSADYNFVSARYFETIGTRLVRGRWIEEQDTPASRHVTVVNEAFVRKFLAQEDPLGRHLGMIDASHSGDYEIVGVVEDAKYRNPQEPVEPMIFFPLLQLVTYKNPSDIAYQTWGNYIDSIQLRVAGRPENLDVLVRRTLAGIDPNLTVLKLTSFEVQVSRSVNSPRLIARLTTLYGVLALLLASIGLYGVAAYTVARRTSEIGIRMALGADRAMVVRMVLRGAMSPIAIGLLIGVPAALAAGRAAASQLYGVKSYDPPVLVAAVAVLAISAVLAAVVPARRAAAIEPMRALRTE